MTLKEYIKKRVSVFVISFIIILIILGVSLYNVLSNKSGDIIVKDNINFRINTIKNDTNNYPMSKEEGEINSSIHKVKVSNKDDEKANFEIVIKDKYSSNLIDKVYYKINDGEVKKINRKHILYEDTLEVGEKREIEVRFWIGSDLLDEKDTGKQSSLYLVVYGK